MKSMFKIGNRMLLMKCKIFNIGKTQRFNSGNPYTSYELGYWRLFIYDR